MRSTFVLSLICALFVTAGTSAEMYITEYLYSGEGDEYIEFTNVGDVAVDLTGWSYEDAHHPDDDPEYLDLSAFGVVAPGESVIITEAATAEVFRADWSLDAAVKVIPGLGDVGGHNIGRADTIHLLDAALEIVDVLEYGDEAFPGTIRAKDISGNPATPAALGANDIYQWVHSTEDDVFGSYYSSLGDLGNPGVYVPEPSALALLVLGGLIAARRRA